MIIVIIVNRQATSSISWFTALKGLYSTGSLPLTCSVNHLQEWTVQIPLLWLHYKKSPLMLKTAPIKAALLHTHVTVDSHSPTVWELLINWLVRKRPMSLVGGECKNCKHAVRNANNFCVMQILIILNLSSSTVMWFSISEWDDSGVYTKWLRWSF